MSCACGCGTEPPPGARYVLHHHLKGRVYSAETRARFRDAQLQRKGPRNSHTPETRAKTKATLDAKKAAGWRQPKWTEERHALARAKKAAKPVVSQAPCACGCGALVKPPTRYRQGHHVKGRETSPELRAKRSASMSRRLAEGFTPTYRDTKPELATQAWLEARGVAFDKHVHLGGFNWDLKAGNALIEVNGCWHHSCPTCGLKGLSKKVPQRDVERARWAAENGFTLVTLWEHAIRVGDFGALEVVL